MVDLVDSAESLAPAQHSSPEKEDPAKPKPTDSEITSISPNTKSDPVSSSADADADADAHITTSSTVYDAAATAAADVLSTLQEKQPRRPSTTSSNNNNNDDTVLESRDSATRDPDTTLVPKPDSSSPSSPQPSSSNSMAKTPSQSRPESPSKPELVEKPPSPPTQPPSITPSPGPETLSSAIPTEEGLPAPINGSVLLSPPTIVTPKKPAEQIKSATTPTSSAAKVNPTTPATATTTSPGRPTLEEFEALQQQVRDLWRVVGTLTAAVENNAASVLGRLQSDSTLKAILSQHATSPTSASTSAFVAVTTAAPRSRGVSFSDRSQSGPRGIKRRSGHRDERRDSDYLDDDDDNQSNEYNDDNNDDDLDDYNSNYDFHHHHYHHHHHYNNNNTDDYYNDHNQSSNEYRGSGPSRRRASLYKKDASVPNVSGALKTGGASSGAASASSNSSGAAGSSSTAAAAGKSAWRQGGNIGGSSNTGSKKPPTKQQQQQQQQQQRLGFHAINTRPPPSQQPPQPANFSKNGTQHKHKKHRRSYSSDRSVSPAARRSDVHKIGGGSSRGGSGRGGNNASTTTSNGDASHTALHQQASQRPLKKRAAAAAIHNGNNTNNCAILRHTDDDQTPGTVASTTPSVKNSPTSGSGATSLHRSMVSAAPTASDLLEEDDEENSASIQTGSNVVGEGEHDGSGEGGLATVLADEEDVGSGAVVLAQQPDPRRYYEGLSERASWMVKSITMEKRNMYGNLILFQDLSVAYLRHGTLINSRVAKQRISPFANDVDEKILSKFLDNLQRYRIYLRKIIEAKIEKISDSVYLTGCLEDVPMLETIYIPDDDENEDDEGIEKRHKKNASKDYDESDEPRPPKPDFDTKLITQGLTRQHLTRGNHLYCICNRVVGYCTSICPCYKANIGCTDKCEMVPEANDFCPSIARRGKKTSVGHAHGHTTQSGQKQAATAIQNRKAVAGGGSSAAVGAGESEDVGNAGGVSGEEESSQ